MPDLDILYTTAAPGWVPPARLSKGNAPPAEIAEAIVKCLAAELRRGGGFPRIAELRDLLRNVADGQIGVRTGFEQLQVLERRSGGALHLRVGCQAARAVLVRVAEGQPADAELGRDLAAEYCRHLVQHRLFGRVRAVLVGECFTDADAAQAWEEEVLLALEPNLIRLADRLVADPTAHKLRAPHRRVARRNTADLLNQPIFGEVPE